MPAKVIAAVNQKGGAGKTTLTMQLAGTLARRGLKVLVVDADPQGTATRWAASAPDNMPFLAAVVGLSVYGSKVHQEVVKFINDYDTIFVDCPPAVDSPAPQSALLIADLALVPIIPSPLDLWSSVGIRQMIENIGNIHEGLQARIVINELEPRTSLSKDVLKVLQEFGIPLTKTALHHRTVYRQSAVFGGTVHAFGNKAVPAIEEMEKLTDEVLAILEG